MRAQNPVTLATRRYRIQFTIAMGAYLIVLFGSRAFFAHVAQPWQTLSALAPVIPLAFIFVAGAHLVRDTDEFARKIMIDSAAIAGWMTALLAATYGFMEGALLPRPSAWATWTLFMGLWLVSSFVLRARYR